MIQFILEFSHSHLIQILFGILIMSLTIRLVAYISSKKNDGYFSMLIREIDLAIEKDKEDKVQIQNIDNYLAILLGKINDKLPNRSLRFKKKENSLQGKKVVHIDGYLSGHEGFLNILRSETGIFHCETPPNFYELSHRILEQDSNWTKILKKIPIDSVSRLIDILPGLFVVFGVFGTFVGISLALPEIAKIDFNNIDASAATLQNFVKNTGYAMESSLTGITCSIIMSLMNALFPIKEMRFRILKKVETSLQALWYHVRFSQNHENELVETLRSINATLKAINPHVQVASKNELPPVPQKEEEEAA